MLGAGFVTLVESDEEMCKIATKNAKDALRDGTYEIQKVEIGKEVPILNEVDLVISNPPWGRQTEGADAHFLDLIISLGVTTHLMHNNSAKHIKIDLRISTGVSRSMAKQIFRSLPLIGITR